MRTRRKVKNPKRTTQSNAPKTPRTKRKQNESPAQKIENPSKVKARVINQPTDKKKSAKIFKKLMTMLQNKDHHLRKLRKKKQLDSKVKKLTRHQI